MSFLCGAKRHRDLNALEGRPTSPDPTSLGAQSPDPFPGIWTKYSVAKTMVRTAILRPWKILGPDLLDSNLGREERSSAL